MKPVQALGREYSMEILGAAERPTSVTHLSESLNIPITTCYRRVHELVAVSLLREVTVDKDDASRATRYLRTTDAVGIRFAPTPSLFAGAFVPVATGADVSTLKLSVQNEVQSEIRSTPIGMPGSNTAADAEQQGSTGNDE